MARCVYLAVEETVADDLSDGLKQAAARIEALEKALLHAADELDGQPEALRLLGCHGTRLIAAAPDLYRCLEGLSKAYAAMDRGRVYCNVPGSWYAHAQAALAKANGEQP